MSKLRETLQNARKSHEHARYPGDLAADVVMQRMSIGRRLFIGAAVAASIAAVVAVVVMLQRTSPQNPRIVMSAPAPATQVKAESPWLSFTIERPGDIQFAFADIAASAASTSTTQASGSSFSASIPAVWGFPSMTSISQELSTSETDQFQSDQEAL